METPYGMIHGMNKVKTLLYLNWQLIAEDGEISEYPPREIRNSRGKSPDELEFERLSKELYI